MFLKRLFSTNLPKAVREQVWLKSIGEKFEGECSINWCRNKINVFNFTVGHDIPRSKGGSDKLDNLQAICSRCNSSMSNIYTIKEWDKKW